jgi:hypothetical protein
MRRASRQGIVTDMISSRSISSRRRTLRDRAWNRDNEGDTLEKGSALVSVACLAENGAPPYVETISLRTARVLVAHLEDGNAFVEMLRAIVAIDVADYDSLIGRRFDDHIQPSRVAPLVQQDSQISVIKRRRSMSDLPDSTAYKFARALVSSAIEFP